ncbi:MAG: tetratricopeptide repeat protein, partial [Betaproteobacteria bacterium]|nr:tetratricopeptide repeat protein [Betaproteobacteria bacterium]
MPETPTSRRPGLSVTPADPRRSRLFPRGTLLGLTLIGVATLALMWPGRHLMQLLRTTQDTALAINYLQHLLTLQEGNAELRLLLAQRYMSIGQWDNALKALGPLGSEPHADALRVEIWKH